jgi:transposase
MMDAPADTAAERGAGADRRYLCSVSVDQLTFLPVSRRELVPPGHLAWFVQDAVRWMDTRVLHRRPGGSLGRRPYDPEMMLALVLYAFCWGVRSSRRIEQACHTDAAFRAICGEQVPDHSTICRFLVDQQDAILELFVEGVRYCAAAGLVDLSVLALDGTKLAADASLARNRDAAWIRKQIAKLIAEAADPGPEPDAIPGLLGEQIVSSSDRLARLERALEIVGAEDEQAAEHARQLTALAAKDAKQGRKRLGRKPVEPHAALARAEIDLQVMQARVAAMNATVAARDDAARRGKKLPAPPPCRVRAAREKLARAETALAAAKVAAAAAPRSRREVNVTDPESRVMNTIKGWVQGYNAQAVINEHQIVLACQVSQDPFDVQLYLPLIAELTHNLAAAGILGEIGIILADAGYWSEANATAPGPERLIATTKSHKQRRVARELGQTDGPAPLNATPLQEMEHFMRTPQGTAAYARRSLIEPCFGNTKHNLGIRTLRRRGLRPARSEWALINLTSNLMKIFRHTSHTSHAPQPA